MHNEYNSFMKYPRPSGNISNYFQSLHGLISPNDGTRSFILRTVDSHDRPPPFDDGQETQLSITHEDHAISDLSDGFITFDVELQLQLIGLDAQFDDPNNLLQIFVGWKSSNQILDQLQIINNNRTTNYQNNECIREGFAYSNVKAKSQKKTRRYIHSLYENVSEYSPTICGTYIPLQKFKDGATVPVTFQVNLPFTDILCFQSFELFPNFCMGDIVLKFYVKRFGLVWCQVDPSKIAQHEGLLKNTPINFAIANNDIRFKHAFTQIGGKSLITHKSTVADSTYTLESQELALNCSGMKILQCKSNMFGFGITEASKQAIRDALRNPVILPSQQIEYQAFPISTTENGIQTTVNLPLNNVTGISIMFPKNARDLTCFENPMLQNVQLVIDNKNYPSEPINTIGARFLAYQLVASDLDGPVECTKEFEDSMTQSRNDPNTQEIYPNYCTDQSSFMLNIQTERNGSAYVFDGLDSGGRNIQIQIKGSPMYTGRDRDSYFSGGEDGGIPPPPQIWLCRDTYFTMDTTYGLQYHAFGTPEGY